MAERGVVSLGVSVLSAALFALFPPACLETHGDSDEVATSSTECTSCHGDPARSGEALRRSAPPLDLSQQTATGNPGVGAHSIHLGASETHGAVACDECHTVPDTVDAPGHDDTARPAELTFGDIARTGGLEPSYDPKRRTCLDSHCHGEGRPTWTEPKTSAEACGSCHGLPPPAPHPQSDNCAGCHGDVIDADRRFVAPERHVNGRVDFEGGECNLCHGGDDNAAPPLDTSGNDEITAIGVGAHQAHLVGGDNGRPVACDECHRVPEMVDEPTHADGLPAELAFGGVAVAAGKTPSWDRVSATCAESWCHTPSPADVHASPEWNVEAALDCTSCHGAPPTEPHPQMTTCSLCHADVVGDDDRTIVAKNLHVNGSVEVAFDGTCNACHGSDDNDAPPRDVAGNSSTTEPGVGAHQAHVLGTDFSRAVPCVECHVVPQSALDLGHMDTARPAELTFSGAAIANGASPVYENGTCSSTPCHGAVFPDGHDSGGSNTVPTWTRVGSGEAECGSCHGLPPPRPHPLPTYPCNQCHENVAADGMSFVNPELHVDGIVTFAVE
jgi:predicted CxxxxCH...CXXCH cytochrome family protein